MVTPEERITRLEAMQEATSQQLALVLSRLDQLAGQLEAFRQEAREMHEAARQEAREANELARREARESVEAARRDARNLFIAAISIGAAVATGLGGGVIALALRILERLPG